MTVFEDAARFAKSVKFEEIRPELREQNKRSLIDYCAVALAASKEQHGHNVQMYVENIGAKPVAGVIGTHIKTSPNLAALANGMMGHLLDYDDNGCLIGHPATVISPAVLAAAEANGATGKEAITAYSAGYMVANCLLRLIERKVWFNCWHITPSVGIFGAVIAAGLLYHLSEHELVMALGIVSSQSSGFQANYGTATKSYQVGAACSKALEAVQLAKLGVTSSPAAWEGDGWHKAYTGLEYSDEYKPTFNYYDGDPELANPNDGMQLKPYPCCGGANTFLESALVLAEEHDIDPERVAHIYVGVDPGGPHMLQCHNPKDTTGARFSAEFMSAAPLIFRTGGLKLFTQECIDDPRTQKLMKKVEMKVDEELTKQYNGWHPSILTITMDDGTVYSRRCDASKGTPDNPLTDQEIVEKFIECAENLMSEEEVEKFTARAFKVEEVEDFRLLIQTLYK